MYAAEKGHTEAVRFLIDKGADVDAQDQDGVTAILLAAEKGHTETVESLIDKGAEFNARGPYGVTAMMIAAQNGHTETVKSLADMGADVNAKYQNGWTAMMIAAERDHTEIVKSLADMGAEVNAKEGQYGRTAVMIAAKEGHTETVKSLVDMGAEINAQDQEGRTAVMIAAILGHTEIVKSLADMGADVDAQEQEGWTAVMIAAQKGHTEIVKSLADMGADVDAQNQEGRTAMMIAAERDHTEIVKSLADMGADVDAQEQEGWTAMMMAAQQGRTEAVKSLADMGADVDAKNQYGRTAVMIAAKNGHTETVKFLVDKGANIDAKTASKIAKEKGRTDATNALADPNIARRNAVVSPTGTIDSIYEFPSIPRTEEINAQVEALCENDRGKLIFETALAVTHSFLGRAWNDHPMLNYRSKVSSGGGATLAASAVEMGTSAAKVLGGAADFVPVGGKVAAAAIRETTNLINQRQYNRQLKGISSILPSNERSWDATQGLAHTIARAVGFLMQESLNREWAPPPSGIQEFIHTLSQKIDHALKNMEGTAGVNSQETGDMLKTVACVQQILLEMCDPENASLLSVEEKLENAYKSTREKLFKGKTTDLPSAVIENVINNWGAPDVLTQEEMGQFVKDVKHTFKNGNNRIDELTAKVDRLELGNSQIRTDFYELKLENTQLRADFDKLNMLVQQFMTQNPNATS